MIQVYKKNELFIIENTVTDIIYPNLTREEALVLLEKFDRNETEHRCDFAIKEDDISFEYASLDDKDKTIAEQRKQITDLEAKFAEKEKERELDNSFWKQECDSLQKTIAEKENTITTLIEDSKISKELLKKQLTDKEQENERLKEEICKYEITLMDKNSQLKKQHQDKISFAVEQLEKVKEKILSYEEIYYQFLESGAKVPVVCLENFRVKQIIDNQINEVKGKVE